MRHVGFLCHPLVAKDMRHFDPAFELFSSEALSVFLQRSQKMVDALSMGTFKVQSTQGVSTDLTALVVPFTTEQAVQAMRSKDLARFEDMVQRALDRAEALGADLVGLGAYTSIVTDNGRALLPARAGLTTGNSLTVAAAAAALIDQARRLGFKKRRLGVVGATGNIGATLAEFLAPDVDRMVLVGRELGMGRLSRLAARLGSNVSASFDLRDLRDCNLIVSASNTAGAIITADHVDADNPVVLCDVATPADVHPEVVTLRPKTRVIHGGQWRLPYSGDIRCGGICPAPGLAFGCMTETLVLGFEGRMNSFSLGTLAIDDVRWIYARAIEHGFKVVAKTTQPRKAEPQVNETRADAKTSALQRKRVSTRA
jgi:predicted amino acid dehydrogenase